MHRALPRIVRSPRIVPLMVAAVVIGLALAMPRVGTAQPCNRQCDASKRDAQGCCPTTPQPPPPPPPGGGAKPPPGGGGSAVGRKCATSQECPGDLVCIDYKCQRPPGTPPPPPPPPPPRGSYQWVGLAWSSWGWWAARSAPTRDGAQAAAVAACNELASGCTNVQYPVPGDGPWCFAVYRNGSSLYEKHDPSLQAAINGALQSCNSGGGNGPGCYQQIAACNDHPIAAPSNYAWVGIGWNTKGTWSTRYASSSAEAQALALDACDKYRKGAGTPCFNAKNPVPGGEKLFCYAIYYDGRDLYEYHDTTLPAAKSMAIGNCQKGGGPQPCKEQVSGCNNRG